MPKFQKGENWNGNRLGRPRRPEVELVRQAIEETEIEKKKSLWKLLIERCYEDNAVLIAVAKKFLPDKIAAEVSNEGYDWKERAEAIIETMKESWERERRE